MADCERKEINSAGCNCTYSCSKHGKCCECVSFHRSMGEFPACFFTDKTERTYDRSFSALKRDRG